MSEERYEQCIECGCEFVPPGDDIERCDACEWEYQDSLDSAYDHYGIGYEYEDDLASMQYDHLDSDLWNEW